MVVVVVVVMMMMMMYIYMMIIFTILYYRYQQISNDIGKILFGGSYDGGAMIRRQELSSGCYDRVIVGSGKCSVV